MSSLFLVSLRVRVISGRTVVRRTGVSGMMLVKLLGAIRPLEFMAFAGNARERHSQDQKGEKFHRAAS